MTSIKTELARRVLAVGVGAATISSMFAVAVLGARPVMAVAPAHQSVTSANWSQGYEYSPAGGDSWFTTWADDGNLYSTSDDTTGWGTCSSNVAISKEVGSDPLNLTGSDVNCMAGWGGVGDAQGHGDNGSWKTSGITSIGGTLYLWITRDIYNDPNNGHRETSKNPCLLKSTDHGQTWSGPSQSTCFSSPMFVTTAFGAPAFVQYGQDGSGGVDGGDTYVYSISNNGSWDNGDSMILGRVPKSLIGNLNASDWQFYSGAGTWSSSTSSAVNLIAEQNHLGLAGVTYDPALGMYILASWYYPGVSGYGLLSNYPETKWNFFQSPKPWGPWTKMSLTDWNPQGYYNPIFVNKFMGGDGLTDYLFTTGNFAVPSLYKLTVVQAHLGTGVSTEYNDNAAGVTYSGAGWVYSPNRGYGDYQDDLHYTQSNGDSVTFNFSGSGIQYIGELYPGFGTANVSVDGGIPTSVSASNTGTGRIAQWTIYASQGLTNGAHTITITKTSGTYATVDAFIVTRPLTNDNDAAVAYSGTGWIYSSTTFGDYGDDLHYTQVNADSASYNFSGTGIQYIGELYPGFGSVSISIDGGPAVTASEESPDGSRVAQATIFSDLELASGSHTITVAKSTGTYATVDAFAVRTTI
ncbi:hypothetical protein EPN29_13185 [bacterium]|nr:MAG: hypothetical protein EPN29_13185 [bacterium]